MPLIPDTLEGALILSLIDFFLSFVVISFIGVVLAGFPWLNRIADWLKAQQHSHAAKPSAAAAPPAAATGSPAPSPMGSGGSDDIPLEDVVAISAVLSALLGEHRILHLAPQQHGAEWLAAGRQAQHHSHAPPPRHGPR